MYVDVVDQEVVDRAIEDVTTTHTVVHKVVNNPKHGGTNVQSVVKQHTVTGITAQPDEISVINATKLDTGRDYVSQDMNSQFFLDSVTCTDTENAWKVTLPICKTCVNFKIDTGADTSVISTEMFNSLGTDLNYRE